MPGGMLRVRAVKGESSPVNKARQNLIELLMGGPAPQLPAMIDEAFGWTAGLNTAREDLELDHGVYGIHAFNAPDLGLALTTAPSLPRDGKRLLCVRLARNLRSLLLANDELAHAAKLVKVQVCLDIARLPCSIRFALLTGEVLNFNGFDERPVCT